MIPNRLIVGGVLLVFCAGAFTYLQNQAYNSGYEDARAEQEQVNRDVYSAIVKRIRDDVSSIDLNDLDAVACELHRLAGTRPKNGECSNLSGND